LTNERESNNCLGRRHRCGHKESQKGVITFQHTKFAFSLSIIAVVLVSVLFPSASLAAYNPSGAASYAEYWWNKRNPDYPNFNTDCTNFVSQAMNVGGGWPERYGSTEDTKWYCDKILWWWSYSSSWINASFLYNYMRNYTTYLGSWKTYPIPAGNNTSITKGDILSYHWDGGGTAKDHSSIVTAYGQDPKSIYYGDLECQHTTDRYRAIWHLVPYNANYKTTVVFARRPY
jgi:hypothetical protein